MKFKENQEEQSKEFVGMSDNLYKDFIDLIQFEIDKLTLIDSVIAYFHTNGFTNYEKFYKYLYDKCKDTKCCLISFLRNNLKEIPEFKIPTLGASFKDSTEPFKMLADMEDLFEEKVNNMINEAFSDKDWKSFYYLLKKLDKVDHLCCRALAAVENKQNPLDLCERRIWENW